MCTAALETCIVIEDGGVCLFFLAFYIKVALFLKRKGQKLPVSHTRHVEILILLLFVNISLVEKSIRGIKHGENLSLSSEEPIRWKICADRTNRTTVCNSRVLLLIRNPEDRSLLSSCS